MTAAPLVLAQLRSFLGQEVLCKNEKFIIPQLTKEQIFQTAIAAYNCGALRGYFTKGDVDTKTTGKDYIGDDLHTNLQQTERVSKKLEEIRLNGGGF